VDQVVDHDSPWRNTRRGAGVYWPATGRFRSGVTGVVPVQVRRRGDLGALALLLGVFVILLVTSIALGTPAIR
jgi:hypothetical protein